MTEIPVDGIRTEILGAYALGRWFLEYANGILKMPSPTKHASSLGVLVWYGEKVKSRRKRNCMKVDEVVANWKDLIVRLTLAHDKDEADAAEADVERCLTPILTAPVKQLREFAPKLLAALKAEKQIPYIVWRAYEVWAVQMEKAPDEDVKELKRDLAKDIADMVEEDVKAQLPDALIRALMWRSPKKLEEVKQVVEEEKAAGRSVRLKGRESCLFLEAGGTEDEPKVCVQI